MSLFKSKQDALTENLYDEQVHGAVASEIAAGELVPGLWAKAFAQADGNEQRAKAIYIKLRVDQLKLSNAAEVERSREAERLRASVTAPRPTQEQRMQQQEQQVKPQDPHSPQDRQWMPVVPGRPWVSLLVNLAVVLGLYLLLK
ncbi:MAG TPA: hypothetical protein PK347_14140 [Burkholderiaceae bacterium]|nr:hypothetical protein [Burkholderiaceae bacterium]